MAFTDVEKKLVDSTVSELVDISKLLKDLSGQDSGDSEGSGSSGESEDKKDGKSQQSQGSQESEGNELQTESGENGSNQGKGDKQGESQGKGDSLDKDLEDLQNALDELGNELDSKEGQGNQSKDVSPDQWDGNDVIVDPNLVEKMKEISNLTSAEGERALERRLGSDVGSKRSSAMNSAKEAGHGKGSRIFDIIDKETQGLAPGWLDKLTPYLQMSVKDFTPNIVKAFRNRTTVANDYNLLLPYNQPIKDNLKDVLFAIDTSGSIQESDLEQFYGQIKELIKTNHVEGSIYFWDMNVRSKGKFKDYSSFVDACKEFKGGGGTDIQDTIKQAIEDKMKLVVVYTDGYFDTKCIKDEQWSKFTYLIWVLYTKQDWLHFEVPFPKNQAKCLLNREEEN